MISKAIFLFCSLLVMLPMLGNSVADFPKVSEKAQTDWFPLGEATICTDAGDYKVVNIAAQMLADDVERVTTARSTIVSATMRFRFQTTFLLFRFDFFTKSAIFAVY